MTRARRSGQGGADLTVLIDVVAMLAERFTPDLLRMLDSPHVSYGNSAVVGLAGDLAHGHALLHPRMAPPLPRRSAAGRR